MLDFKLAPQQQEELPAGDGEQKSDQVYDLIIVGGGPAGLTSAIYAGRAGLKTLVLAGSMPGGQVATTDYIENFPGFPEGIEGAELAQRMQAQAERFVERFVADPATEVVRSWCLHVRHLRRLLL
jgi:thioredoxin reductase (NADPH)